MYSQQVFKKEEEKKEEEEEKKRHWKGLAALGPWHASIWSLALSQVHLLMDSLNQGLHLPHIRESSLFSYLFRAPKN